MYIISIKKMSRNLSREILDTIHCDLCSPFQTPTTSGKRHFLTLVNEFSHYREKVNEKIIEYIQLVKNQKKLNLKLFNSDRGEEFINRDIQK